MMTADGTTSVISDTISPTSPKSLLSTSPLCIFPTPLHSPWRSLEKKLCCMMFWVFTPRTALTHVFTTLSNISKRSTNPKTTAMSARFPS